MFLELWKGSSPSSQPSQACPCDVAGRTSSGRAVSRTFKVRMLLTSEDDNGENNESNQEIALEMTFCLSLLKMLRGT